MTQNPATPSFRERLFARLMAKQDANSAETYGDRKRELLRDLRGTVVEIGPGTGVNLEYLDGDVRWIGLEPNAAMHSPLRQKAAEMGRTIDLRAATIEDASIEPDSADAVISTLVLCSVPSVARVLEGVLTTLKPGGSFVFIEHVVDLPWTLRRLVQKSAPFTPWRYFSDGCHPGRDIAREIRDAGFSDVRLESYMQEGKGVISAVNRPHICGTAVK